MCKFLLRRLSGVPIVDGEHLTDAHNRPPATVQLENCFVKYEQKSSASDCCMRNNSISTKYIYRRIIWLCLCADYYDYVYLHKLIARRCMRVCILRYHFNSSIWPSDDHHHEWMKWLILCNSWFCATKYSIHERRSNRWTWHIYTLREIGCVCSRCLHTWCTRFQPIENVMSSSIRANWLHYYYYFRYSISKSSKRICNPCTGRSSSAATAHLVL